VFNLEEPPVVKSEQVNTKEEEEVLFIGLLLLPRSP
jgi:hypothetical protein